MKFKEFQSYDRYIMLEVLKLTTEIFNNQNLDNTKQQWLSGSYEVFEA